jgi:hypothetical protein
VRAHIAYRQEARHWTLGQCRLASKVRLRVVARCTSRQGLAKMFRPVCCAASYRPFSSDGLHGCEKSYISRLSAKQVSDLTIAKELFTLHWAQVNELEAAASPTSRNHCPGPESNHRHGDSQSARRADAGADAKRLWCRELFPAKSSRCVWLAHHARDLLRCDGRGAKYGGERKHSARSCSQLLSHGDRSACNKPIPAAVGEMHGARAGSSYLGCAGPKSSVVTL